MAEIILFNPLCDPKRISFTIPPWALLYVSSGLVEDKYDVAIIDQNTEVTWKKRLREKLQADTILVGVTAMTGLQINYALKFIREVKRLSKAPIVWGGAHASFFSRQTVMHPLVDYVIVGEGEQTIRELAFALKNKTDVSGIRGLVHKRNGKVLVNKEREFTNLDDNKRVPYELIDVEKYIYKTDYARRNFEICTSRGCPHRCGFCYNVCYNKGKWRTMNVEKILENLKEMVEKYQLDGINWREDNFFVDKKRVEAICRAIIDSGLKVKWHCDSRIDYFDKYDDPFIELLVSAGCARITFGIESGSPKVLRKIQKDIEVDQVIRVNQKMKRHGIKCMYHFSFGYIGETMDDVIMTVRLADRLIRENPNAGIWPPSIYTPYPGTPLFDEAVKNGFKVPEKLEDFETLVWAKANIPWLTKEEAKKIRAVSYIMSGYASKIPIANQWFSYRWDNLIQRSAPGIIPEKAVTDKIMSGIRSSRLILRSVFA